MLVFARLVMPALTKCWFCEAGDACIYQMVPTPSSSKDFRVQLVMLHGLQAAAPTDRTYCRWDSGDLRPGLVMPAQRKAGDALPH